MRIAGNPDFGHSCGRLEEPVSAFMAANAGLISAVGAVTNVIGTMQQSKAAQASANAQAQAAAYNQQLAQQEASAEEARRRRMAAAQMGAIRSGIAKSGASMEGTPLAVLASSAEQAEMDALNARWEGRISSNLYGMEASAARSRAAAEKKALPFAVGSSLLSSAASYYKK